MNKQNRDDTKKKSEAGKSETGFRDARSTYDVGPEKLRTVGRSFEDGPKPIEKPDPMRRIVGRKTAEAAFLPKDAASRKDALYVIPFGLPGSGKTTMPAALFKSISEHPHLASEPVVHDRDDLALYSGQVMADEWARRLQVGEFMEATRGAEEDLRELSYEISPTKGQKKKLKLGILEVGGELLQRVVPRADRDPQLPKAMSALIANRNIRKMLVLVVHPNQLTNDEMFPAVVVANPVKALEQLHANKPELQRYQRLTPEVMPRYLQAFAPRTLSILKGWPSKQATAFPLFIGKTRTVQRDDSQGWRRWQRRSTRVFR